MKTFVLRNTTLEAFFDPSQVAFSGYADVSAIPTDVDLYLWWYLAPYKANLNQIASEIENFSQVLEWAFKQIPSSKTMIAFTMESLFEVSSLTSPSEVKRAIQKHNEGLFRLSEQNHNLKVIDFSTFTRNYTLDQLIDWKYYFISMMPLNPKLAKDFKCWFDKQISAILFQRKKCLVLDLDHTLWGGIVGEEGVWGIKIGGDYPGSAFLYFQNYILELQKQGVILAICSKNNIEDIRQVWEQNTSNQIREDAISAYRINWQDKASNIQEIAQELNIGLDSMVFVDDNPSERELVRGMLPDVTVPEFPKQAYQLPEFIAQIARDYFLIYQLTEEDTRKTEQYKANTERKRIEQSFANIEDYYRSLDIQLLIREACPETIERIAQMTQKTNQFNLSTKRYSQGDIEDILHKGGRIWTLAVRDKFGDQGITGVAIVNIKNEIAKIDSFLLSCRILGKEIEQEFCNYILSKLKEMACKKAIGIYIPTAKNAQVAGFYLSLSFEKTEDPSLFERDLDAFVYIPNQTYTLS